MMSSGAAVSEEEEVDLRSDTVTRPTVRMREAMAAAEVGDDVLGCDPTVKVLEEKVAALFGKEAALFVPSGTQANLINVMAQTWERGSEYIVGDEAHIYIYEQGGGAVVGGSHPRAVRTEKDGTLALSALERAVRGDDQHFPVTTMICLENSHNVMGGTVLPQAYVQDVADLAHSKGLKLHVDGARIWHAADVLGLSLADIARPADSLAVCLSKGLGAPAGSLVVGDLRHVQRAKRLRKLLGGAMRQSGVLAAAGIVALDDHLPNLPEDHLRAKRLADAISSDDAPKKKKGPLLTVERTPDTNILFTNIHPDALAASEVLRKDPGQIATFCAEHFNVNFLHFGNGRFRFVTHHQVDDRQLLRAIHALSQAADHFL